MNNNENMKETIEKDLLHARNRHQEWRQFGYKQCYYTECVFNEETQNFYKLVRSYNTIVAILYDEYYIELGKWSTTTSRQVTQFYNEYVSRTGQERLFINMRDFCDRL